MRPSEVFRSVGRPIAYYPRLAKVCGGVTGSVLICQFLYWTDRTKDPEGWIYKTQAEIEDETGLTPKEQRHARQELGETLESRYDRLHHRQYYRVNTDLLDQAIEAAWGTAITVQSSLPPKVLKGTSGNDERAVPESPSEELPKADFGNSGNGTSYKNQRLPTEREEALKAFTPTAAEATPKAAIANSKTPKAKPPPKTKTPPHPETQALVAYFAELADTPTLKAATARMGQQINKALGASSAPAHIREAIGRVVREGAPGAFERLLSGVERYHAQHDPASRDTPIARMVLGLADGDKRRRDDGGQTLGEIAAEYGYEAGGRS